MTVQFSDPHQALSWDGMHAHDHGLGGKHHWPELQKFIKEYGRNGPSKVDAQYAVIHLLYCAYKLLKQCRAQSFPTWRKLYHFSKVMDVTYTDASKLKDLVNTSLSHFLQEILFIVKIRLQFLSLTM